MENKMEHERMLLLTVPEAAQRLSLGRSLMYELVRSRKIPSIKIGRLRRVPSVELEHFIARQLAAESTEFGASAAPSRVTYRNGGD